MAEMASEVWFSIFPTNKESEAIVEDVRNIDHVVTLDGAGDAASKVIQVIFRDDLRPYCILSFGRGSDSDIKCDLPGTAIGRNIAQRQCSFYFHNRCLILRDHSDQQSTTISPVHLKFLDKWRMDQIPRQRVIPEYGDWCLFIGHTTFLLYFRQNERWWERDFGKKDALAAKIIPDAFALTDPPPPISTTHKTRVQSPEVPQGKKHDPIVYHELERLGTGAIGSVSRVIDLQLGQFMVVKIIPVEEGKEKVLKETAKKEVELIAKPDHDHIIEFVHSKGWKMGKPIQIFMLVAGEIIHVQKWRKKKSF